MWPRTAGADSRRLKTTTSCLCCLTERRESHALRICAVNEEKCLSQSGALVRRLRDCWRRTRAAEAKKLWDDKLTAFSLLSSIYVRARGYKHYFAWASGSAVMSPVSLFYPPLKPNVELHVVIILEIFFSCFNYVLILCSYKTPKVSDHTWMSYCVHHWDSSLVKCKEVKSAFLCQTHEDGYFYFTTFCFRMEI